MYDVFGRFGPIRQIRKGKTGDKKGTAFIVYDDISLPRGSLRFRANGSAGGHNGIKSIIEYLGTEEFPRLRIGIGAQAEDGPLTDHVLGRFDAEEWAEMEKVLAIAVDGVNCALSAGLDTAMNQFNRRG